MSAITVIDSPVRITWRQWDRMIAHGWATAAGLWTARGHLTLLRRDSREIQALIVD